MGKISIEFEDELKYSSENKNENQEKVEKMISKFRSKKKGKFEKIKRLFLKH